MKSLSDDILEYGILACLPVKPLLRFQCVSKKWHRLISSDAYFIYLQSRGPSCVSGVAGFLFMAYLEYPAAVISRTAVGIPPNFPMSHIEEAAATSAATVASSDGLVCVEVCTDEIRSVYIGNPAVKDWTCVDHMPDTRFPYFGLAVDVGERGVSYNLVVAGRTKTPLQPSDHEDNVEFGFWVFSSRTQQWKMSSERIMLPYSCWQRFDNVPVYVKGSVHWMVGDSHVLWFNPEKQCSGLEPLPLPEDTMRPPDIRKIGEWNGELSYATMTDEEVQIWSMDRPSRWSKRVSIPSAKIIGGIDPAEEFPAITSREQWEVSVRADVVALMPFQGGDGLWFFWYGSIFCYDLVTGEVSKHADAWDSYRWFPYHNSLIYLPKGEV